VVSTSANFTVFNPFGGQVSKVFVKVNEQDAKHREFMLLCLYLNCVPPDQ